jgi:hypothetical protein
MRGRKEFLVAGMLALATTVASAQANDASDAVKRRVVQEVDAQSAMLIDLSDQV